MADPASSTTEMIESDDVPFIPENIGSHNMAISNFSQVIFPDVPDFYSPEIDIKVCYIITEAIEPSSRDWIGVFRVGWTSPRDYTTYVWAPKAKTLLEYGSGNRTQTVPFQAYQLPGDDNEFYQFCYVTKQGYVRGASTPFQFRMSTENDNLVECEDENGLIILKTKSDALEEQLSKAEQEQVELEKKIENLNNEKIELESNLAKLSSDLQSTEKQLQSSEENNKVLESQLTALNAEHDKITMRLSKADQRIEKTKQKLVDAEKKSERLLEDIESLQQEILRVTGDNAALEKKHIAELQEKDMQLQRNEADRLQMLDQIKTLSLQQDELKQSAQTDISKTETRVKSLEKKNDDLVSKLQHISDERDLFKTQFSKTEIARQQAADKLEVLAEQLRQSQENIEIVQQKLNLAETRVSKKKLEMEKVNRKCREENNKMADALRNSSEQVNALDASKRLLRQELTEVTNGRDRLMVEMNTLKKDKEAYMAELRGAESTIHALESQLETAEDRLIQCERAIVDHEREIMEERRNAEEAERDMHRQILLLRKQLEESDQAVAHASSRDRSQRPGAHSTKNQRTQTKKKSPSKTECQQTDVVADVIPKEEVDAKEETIAELQKKVEDLTNRLAMGADAYKGKFVECHKLEKKLKKIKQQSAKQAATSQTDVIAVTSTGTGSDVRDDDGENPGFMNSLHKILMAIADPDAEEQEQGKQLKGKLEAMEKSIQTEHNRYIKYKQLYNDEKKEHLACKNELEIKDEEHKRLTLVEDGKYQLLSDENDMLKVQLSEFVNGSNNPAVQHAMSYLREYSDNGELSSSPDSGQLVYPHEPENYQNEEENSFEDAPGYPMQYPHNTSTTTTTTGSSDSMSDDATEHAGVGRPGFSPLCAEPSAGTSVTRSAPISCEPSKVISRQPVRSPPQLDGATSRQAQQPSSATQRKSKSSKGAKKRRSRKNVSAFM